jgi:DNA-binding SARP family transcriptional activator
VTRLAREEVAPVFTLQTLGSVELSGPDGEPITSVLAQPKRTALLVYLAAATPRGFHRRDTLAALFWPEDDESHARSSLRVALHFLRQSLGPEVGLVRGSEEVAVNPEQLWCEVVALEDALAEGRLVEAVELYRGPFLDGFHLPGTPRFERWVEETRRHLRKNTHEAASSLAQRSEEAGDLEDAARWASRAFGLAPYDEPALRRLLHLLDLTGNRAGALQAYERFAARIDAELGATPSPETANLIEEIRTRSEPSDRVESLVSGSGEASRKSGRQVPAVAVRDAAAGPAEESAPAAEVSHLEASAGSDTPRQSSRHSLFLGVTAAIVLLATVGYLAIASWTDSTNNAKEGTYGTLVSRRIVVTVLENQTGDPVLDPVGFLAADRITAGLAQTGLLEVVSAPPVFAATIDAARSSGAIPIGRDWLMQVAEETVAGTVVWGSYYGDGDSIQIQVNISDMTTDRLLGTVGPVSASRDAPLRGVVDLSERTLGLLAAEFDERLRSVADHRSSAPGYTAYLEYIAGFKATSGEAKLGHLLRAHSLDTSFVAPLVQILSLLGSSEIPPHRYGVADTVFAILDRSAERLTETDRLIVEGWRSLRHGDRVGRYRAHRRLAALAPEYQWLAALAGWGIGRYREFTEILLNESYPRVWRPYPWKSVTAALHFLGEHEKELEVARNGRAENPGLPVFYGMEVTALAALGHMVELEQIVELAVTEASWRGGRTEYPIFAEAGVELRWHGHDEAARKWLRVAAEANRKTVADRPDWPYGRSLLAKTLINLEAFEETREVLEPVFRQTPEPRSRMPKWWELEALAHAGIAAARTGQRTEALRLSDLIRQLETSPVGDLRTEAPFGFAGSSPGTFYRAWITAALEECDQAAEMVQEAFDAGLATWMIHRRVGLYYCRNDPTFREVTKPR